MKKITLLGSTGSCGTQTLNIVRAQGDLQVTALAAGKNIDLLEQQIREFHPNIAAVWDEKGASELKIRVKDLPVRIVSGMEGVLEAAAKPDAEMAVNCITGMIGIRPTIAAIESGKNLALANKETLVTAGHLIMPLASENHISLLPIDSEHSAIFQALQGEEISRVDKILLTTSGGPFRGWKRAELETVRVEDALRHPRWNMGAKITIDSATLVNKGLELMEAGWLFNVSRDQIEVVVQPQSIIHSMVQFVDGAVIAQLGVTNMELPIQYALYYPERRPSGLKPLDFFELGQLTFERPDTDTFVSLQLADRAMRKGGSLPTVFNAANERAVALFLNHEIRFLDIFELIEYCMDECAFIENPTLSQVFETEQNVYDLIERFRN